MAIPNEAERQKILDEFNADLKARGINMADLDAEAQKEAEAKAKALAKDPALQKIWAEAEAADEED